MEPSQSKVGGTNAFKRIKYPTIRIYTNRYNHHDDSSSKSRPTNNAYTDISYQHLHPYEVLEKLGMIAHYDDDTFAYQNNNSNNNNSKNHPLNHNIIEGSNKEGYRYPYRSGKELFHDVHVALGELLHTVVFSSLRNTDHVRLNLQSPPPTTTKKHSSELSITEQEVLKAFLMLLHKVIPANTYSVGVQGMIKGIIDSFTYAVKNQNYMNVLMNKYQPVPTQYSNHTCPTVSSINDDTNMDRNKYTCAMWDVLLLISIGIVDYNIQSYDATEMIHPASALHIIFEFVKLFGMSSTITTTPSSSSSSSSSNHTLDDIDTVRTQFIDLYNDCTFMNRCHKLPDAPKFIYNNNKDQVSKEYITKITTTYEEWILLPLYISTIRNMTLPQRDLSSTDIWPPTNVCVVCWKVEASEKSSLALTYDETNMYKYLKLVYGRIEAITTTYQSDLFNEGVTKIKERQVEIKSLTNERLKQNKVQSLPRQHLVNMDGLKSLIHVTKSLVRPQITSNTILSMRHGSICILFLIVTMWRWIYTRRHPKGVVAMPQSNLYDRIIRLPQAILHTFRSSESNLAPRKMLSPRKRRILNRRFAIEQENEKSRRPLSRQSSFRLDQLEASKCADGDRNNESLDQIIFTSIPTSPPSLPLECKSITSNKNISSISFDTMQKLRQRKPSHTEPAVKM